LDVRGFEVLTAVSIKSTSFRVVTPNIVRSDWSFFVPVSTDLLLGLIFYSEDGSDFSSETSGTLRTLWCCNPEELSL
jgi:hypothetical protein